MIKIINASKFFKLDNGQRHYIFRNLTFTFPENKNIGILGLNGAGKSTILRILGGIEKLNEGKIETNKTFSWVVGLTGGFQGNLSALDNIKFVYRLYGICEKEIQKKINFVKNFADIGEYFFQPMENYSSGMRSRVAFGLSLSMDFDYYLIDEITSVGDSQFKEKSKKLYKEVLKTRNVIMVSHNLEEIKEICDIIIILEKGNLKIFEDKLEGLEYYKKLK